MRIMRIKFIVPLVLLLASLPILVACGGKETVVEEKVVERIVEVEKKVEPITFKIQAAWPTTNMIYDNLVDFAERVEKMSGGRLIIEPLPSGAIVPAFEIQDATSVGVIDGGHTAMGYILGKSRAAIPLSHGPVYGMDMIDMWGWYYNGGGIELLQEWYQEELGLNIVSFPIAPAGPQALGWFNKEINSLEDIVGLKYRIYGIGNEVYGKIGVSVIQLPGGEILPALERGVLDAAEWVGGRMDLQLGFQDILKLHYTPGMHEPVTYSDLIINKDKFDALGPDLQAIIEAAANQTAFRWWTKFAKENALAYKEMVDIHGVDVRKTPDSILYEFLRVYDELVLEDSAADPFYAKVVASQKEYAGLIVPYRMSTWPAYDFAGKHYWEDEIFLK